MPKSQAEMARESIARKRRQAREAGWCCVCCKQKPRPGRRVCEGCLDQARRRSIKRRERLRSKKRNVQIAKAHVQAGHEAYEAHRYEDAVQHYQYALTSSLISEEQRPQVSEKLAYALFFAGNPRAATASLEQGSLLLPHGNGDDVRRKVRLLLQKARNLHSEIRIQEIPQVHLQALELAKKTNDRNLENIVKVQIAANQRQLGVIDRAQLFLDAAGRIRDDDDIFLRCLYHRVKAVAYADLGDATNAYAHFDKAIQIAKENIRAYDVTLLWGNYAAAATELGSIQLAKKCFEQALLIARNNRLIWRIAYLCLAYADLLRKIGQPALALGYLLEALEPSEEVPILDLARVKAGIPIALDLKDPITLSKCLKAGILTRALASGAPEFIASISSVFSRLYAFEGNKDKAKALVRRAIPKIANLAYGYWDFVIEVARYGRWVDVAQAKALLEKRLRLPNAGVARAFSCYFDAIVLRRQGKIEPAMRSMEEGSKLFEQLQWFGYADTRRCFADAPQAASVAVARMEPVHALSDLTLRERQVAELVLRGMTNRAIASELSITQNTVEKHMTSIMGRLGVRSRYQLDSGMIGGESEITESVMRLEQDAVTMSERGI